jgi:hypothetical protein
MTPLTVACLFVRGEYPYTVEYVDRLKAIVDRWIDRPCRFVCLTDQPDTMPDGVEAIPVEKWPDCFAYWTKLELFNPARQWSGRVLYLDLDTLIVQSLAPIVDFPAGFALTGDPTGKRDRDRYKRLIIRKFNSSVMVWDGGTQTRLYDDWAPTIARHLSGDQDWIGLHARGAQAMPRAWFPRLSEVSGPPFGEAKVILTKHPKNHVAMQDRPWLAPLWGAA